MYEAESHSGVMLEKNSTLLFGLFSVTVIFHYKNTNTLEDTNILHEFYFRGVYPVACIITLFKICLQSQSIDVVFHLKMARSFNCACRHILKILFFTRSSIRDEIRNTRLER
jgi:hypothetical protein